MLKYLTNTINFKLFIILSLSSLITILYTTIRINFLGEIPIAWGLNIASQIVWLNILYEVLKEAFLLPLFYILGSVLNNKKELSNRISFSLFIYVFLYLILTLFIHIFTIELINSVNQTKELVLATVNYIKLESIAILLSSIFSFLNIILILKDKIRLLYLLLFTKTICTILLDSLFISNFSFSLNLGVNAIAYTNIIVSLLLTFISLKVFKNLDININLSGINNLNWLKEWFLISIKSGLESLVRNLAFVFFILKIINTINQQGIFWITNNFIWGWLLLPILSIGELIKKDSAISKDLSSNKFKGYFLFTLIIITFWIISIPFWDLFIKNIMGVSQFQEVKSLALLFLLFYIIFAFNNIIDSYFYGIGRTDLMLYQSLIVNIIYYGFIYYLYTLNYIIPTLKSIALIFGGGLIFDAIITLFLFIRIRKRKLF